MTVANDSGKLRFRSFGIDAYNANDTSQQLFLNTNNSNAVRCNKLGVGANAGVDTFNCSGGNAYFGSTVRFQGETTCNNSLLIWNNSKIYRRADANDRLNVISSEEVNFSLQPNRATDPTTGTIALQLNDTSGITLNRAVVNNLTFNSIGNIVGEADVVSWGRFMFQFSSELREVLDTPYTLYIRNGDTLGEMNLTIGLESSTPEIQLTDGKVNVLGNLEITHIDDAGAQEITINNPDDNGWIRLSNSGLSRLDATTTGVDVYGVLTTTGNADINGDVTCVALTETSDVILKENINEVSTKECYKVAKYIKPKTYNFSNDESKKSNIGFVADDLKDAKKPKEWDNMVYYNDDRMKLLAYNKAAVVLWGAVRHLVSEKDELLEMVKSMKKRNFNDERRDNKAEEEED